MAGLSADADAFFVAIILARFFTSILRALNLPLIPVIVASLEENNLQQTARLSNVIGTVILLIAVLLTALMIVLANWVVRIIAPGFDQPTQTVTVNILRILYLTLPLIAVSNFLSAVLNSHKRFAISSANNLIRFGIAIGCILAWQSSLGIYSVAIGLGVGSLVRLLITWLACYIQAGYQYRITLNWRGVEIGSVLRLLWAPILGIGLRRTIPIVERMIASFLPVGSVAILGYANQLPTTIGQFLLTSVTRAALPDLSAAAQGQKNIKLAQIFLGTARILSLISFPITAFLIGVSQPIVRLLLQRGTFSLQDAQRVVPVLACYALVLLFLGHVRLTRAYFYAIQQTKIVALLFMAITLSTIVLDLVLVPWLGLIGLAWGFVFGTCFSTMLGYYLIARREKTLSFSQFNQLNLRLAIASVVTVIIIYGSTLFLTSQLGSKATAQTLTIIVGWTIGGLSLLLLADRLGIKEPLLALRYLKKRITR